jgi:hypothetical protein
MTAGELARIEQALGIELPPSYRARMLAFPIRAAAGNADLGVWDNADRLIEYNLELRNGAPGGVKPWPRHFFALGHMGDGSPYALDLSDGDAVWWVDVGHLDNESSQKEATSFARWADDYFRVLREEMAGEGVDPDATADVRAVVEAKNARMGFVGCLLAVGIIGAIIFGIVWLVKR